MPYKGTTPHTLFDIGYDSSSVNFVEKTVEGGLNLQAGEEPMMNGNTYLVVHGSLGWSIDVATGGYPGRSRMTPSLFRLYLPYLFYYWVS